MRHASAGLGLVETITVGGHFVDSALLRAELTSPLPHYCDRDLDSAINDNFQPKTYSCIEAARRHTYRRLPYGTAVPNEWGTLIYKTLGRWRISAPIEGREHEVPFRVGRQGSRIFTLDGLYGISGNHPIVEFAHTHPADPSQAYANFSGGNGDIWWANQLKIPFSMRYADRVALYDPLKSKMRLNPVTGDIIGQPGRTLFRLGEKEQHQS